MMRPRLPKDNLLQPTASAALPVVLKSADRGDYTISIRSENDTSKLQLEWINKKTLRYPTATIYQDTMNTNNVSNAALIGRIEARGTYRSDLDKRPIRKNYHFILYDFIHQKIIDSITF